MFPYIMNRKISNVFGVAAAGLGCVVANSVVYYSIGRASYAPLQNIGNQFDAEIFLGVMCALSAAGAAATSFFTARLINRL